jgi:glycoprotein 6-alpha-L-fucosyltransferase
VIAIYDHVPRREYGEIELRKGDLIGLAGNHWNGYSKGVNHRSNQEGLFPSYKVVDYIESF